MRYQEAEERPKLLEELGHRLQYYATVAGEFRKKVSGLKVSYFLPHSFTEAHQLAEASDTPLR